MWCLHGHKYPFSYQVAGVLFSVPIAVREGILGKWGAVEPEGGAGSEESLSMAFLFVTTGNKGKPWVPSLQTEDFSPQSEFLNVDIAASQDA